jgi:hypothetical protein
MKIEGHNTSSVTAETVEAKAEARLLLEENGMLREALRFICAEPKDWGLSWLELFEKYQRVARAALGEKE